MDSGGSGYASTVNFTILDEAALNAPEQVVLRDRSRAVLWVNHDTVCTDRINEAVDSTVNKARDSLSAVTGASQGRAHIAKADKRGLATSRTIFHNGGFAFQVNTSVGTGQGGVAAKVGITSRKRHWIA
jgi:hypothetical protein